jgi:hypothetical protein
VPYISDVDRTAFENLCKGIYDFNEEELSRLHKAAEDVKEVIKLWRARQDKRAGASFTQMG